ncbi:unnamed protein product [Brassica napus]|uniref:(rape) hypothetical protein n=1 Tax=Brassica napus TaxID=3708 RepID=A0A816VPS9_BRANA|nr:unnamed protein product [Brassica napus]
MKRMKSCFLSSEGGLRRGLELKLSLFTAARRLVVVERLVFAQLSGVDLLSMVVATASPVTALSLFASRAGFSHFARTLCETTSPSVSAALWVCSLYGGALVVAQ